jgi:outer membrane protein
MRPRSTSVKSLSLRARPVEDPALSACRGACALAVVLLLLPLFGCQAPGKLSGAISVPEERLREIEPLDLQAMVAPETPSPVTTAPSETPAPSEIKLTLEECRAAALENNLDLKASLVSPSIAAESVTEEEARFEALFFSDASFSKTDDFSPGAGASGSEGVALDPGLRLPLVTGGTFSLDFPMVRGESSGYGRSYTTDARWRLSQPLMRNAWPKSNTHAIRIARYQSAMSQAGTKLDVVRTIAETDRIYWRLYAARRELDVRRNEYDLAVAQLERARRRVQAGAVSEVEVTRAESGVADRAESIIIAQNTVRQRERSLRRAIARGGLSLDSTAPILLATEPSPLRFALDAPRLIKAALDGRMEMLELELQLAQDASTIDFQRNATLPLLSLDYTYNVNGAGSTAHDSFDLLNDGNFEDHTIGLNLEIPLGNAAARSRLRRAVLSRIQRLATREAREAQVKQEVLDAVDQIEAGWQRILANRQRRVLADRTLSAEIRQFELGLRTSTDVLNAQTSLANAQSAEITALADYQIAQTDLAFATGTLLGSARIRWQPLPQQTSRPK